MIATARPCASSRSFFAMPGRTVTVAASRVREVFCAAFQTQSDPEGGHPVRVVGGTWEVRRPGRKQKLGLARAGLAVEGDHADFRWALAAAIDYLLAHKV